MKDEIKNTNDTIIDLEFSFYSSNNNQWEKRKRSDILLPFSQ
jgi:hypothetical protein